MNNFRFANKYEINILISFSVASGILIFLETPFPQHSGTFQILLTVVIVIFLFLFVQSKQSNKIKIENITTTDQEVKFSVFSRAVKPLQIHRHLVKSVITEDGIDFYNNQDNVLIGKAFKSHLQNKEDWKLLLDCFK